MPTKNDLAWEKLFHRYEILKHLKDHSCYEIEAKVINTVRESRLMAKFDHYINLPKIFKEHKLSILPLSRSKYIIGSFNTYQKVTYDEQLQTTPISFPYHIESIDSNNLYSETAALHAAFISGIINEVAGEKMHYAVSGRMSTSSFQFNIRNPKDQSFYRVAVENSQCEIDAGFEGKDSFLLIEAKNFAVEDFLIRQLYYPYRLWSQKLGKKVMPVLMTYSNDLFSFFIYEFQNSEEYNSLQLKAQKNFIFTPEIITFNEITQLVAETMVLPEPEVPFPQADKFQRVIDLLGLLVENDLTKEFLTQNYQFDSRQTDYYTNSAIYLGLVSKYKNTETNEITYCLTDPGRQIMQKKHKTKTMLLIKKILAHEVFNRVFRYYLDFQTPPSLNLVCEIMKNCNLYHINPQSSTIPRRAQTVISWINWIKGLLKENPGR